MRFHLKDIVTKRQEFYATHVRELNDKKRPEQKFSKYGSCNRCDCISLLGLCRRYYKSQDAIMGHWAFDILIPLTIVNTD